MHISHPSSCTCHTSQPVTGCAHTSTSSQIRPEFFALPPRGGDAFFGLSKSTYYQLEKQGLIKMVRLRMRGSVRGKVLVPYDAVRALLARMN